MNRSTSVTIEATTRMNTGMRTSWVIWLRNIPTSMASTPLFSHRPSLTMVLYCAAILMSLLVHLCFGGVHVHHLLLVGGEQFEPATDGVNDAARRGGGAGELGELAAVFLYLPLVRRRRGQGQAIEAQYPVAFLDFHLVAQAGSLLVGENAHAEDFSLCVDAHHQL